MTKIKAVARRAGYLTSSEDAFGRKASGYDGIPLVDLGEFVEVEPTALNHNHILDDLENNYNIIVPRKPK